MAHVMRESIINALHETLTEVQAYTLGDASTDVNSEELLHALADTVGEVEAETLYKTLNDIKAEKLVDGLNDRLAKDKSRNYRRHTAGCCS